MVEARHPAKFPTSEGVAYIPRLSRARVEGGFRGATPARSCLGPPAARLGRVAEKTTKLQKVIQLYCSSQAVAGVKPRRSSRLAALSSSSHTPNWQVAEGVAHREHCPSLPVQRRTFCWRGVTNLFRKMGRPGRSTVEKNCQRKLDRRQGGRRLRVLEREQEHVTA